MPIHPIAMTPTPISRDMCGRQVSGEREKNSRCYCTRPVTAPRAASAHVLDTIDLGQVTGDQPPFLPGVVAKPQPAGAGPHHQFFSRPVDGQPMSKHDVVSPNRTPFSLARPLTCTTTCRRVRPCSSTTYPRNSGFAAKTSPRTFATVCPPTSTSRHSTRRFRLDVRTKTGLSRSAVFGPS